MNGFIRLMIIGALLASFIGCASNQSQNDDLSLEGDSIAAATEDQAAVDGGPVADDTAVQPQDDFGDASADKQAAEAAPAPEAAPAAPAEVAKNDDADLSLDDEMKDQQASAAPQPSVDQPPVEPETPQSMEVKPPADAAADPFADTPGTPPQQTAEVPPPAVVPEPAPLPEVAPPATPMAAQTTAPPVEITGVKFQANDAGGTVVVEANGPVAYTTRTNPDLKQFVVEVENAHLPSKLKRSLNTKDIRGAIGTVDAYQNAGSTTARFVIQMRDGVANPTVQAEGNSLLIVSGGAAAAPEPTQASNEPAASNGAAAASAAESTSTTAAAGDTQYLNSSDPNVNMSDDKILASQNLSDFMAGNTKFYGKKISIETSNMDVREALKFLTEESGVNMVISDEVKGNLSLKLRQVPWDQALVVIMKARKLGYTRQGNVLRIAPLTDLRQEEDDAAKLALAHKAIEPMKVRMFPISYAKVDELEKKIKDFLSEKGKVIGDPRTNALVVTDQEDVLSRVAKLVANLDVQPPQVLIEGKIVEAKDSFMRSVGVNWGSTGAPVNLGSGKRGPVNMTPSFSTSPSVAGTGNFNLGLNIGTLDFLGNLTASLALSERDEQVKVISSPRIMTLSNEQASISQTTELPLKTVTVTNGTTQETYQFKPVTLKLDVTPQITSDSSVIMKIEVDRQFAGAVVSTSTEAVPINSREAKTRVLVKNGQTAVIGGIYQSDATDFEVGIPWAKDLPIVGSLFRTTTKTKEKIELVIFLTPRIMAQMEAAAASSATQDF